MQPLSEALAPWHDFYMLMGGASATMTGLLFVAASVSSGTFSRSGRAAQRMFLSASVVQFGTILASCLIVVAPLQHWGVLGGLILTCGVFGLAYSAISWRDSVRDGLSARIDLEDRSWYAVAPAIGYVLEAAAGVALLLRLDLGCAALAVATGALMLVAIHNAWDITVWSVTRKGD
jgi:modulator of FtsH protease